MTIFDRTAYREKRPRVSVEVILDGWNGCNLQIRTSEDAKPISIPGGGSVSVTRKSGGYATLTMSEDKAISYNLV